jgi:hypothetical protein
VVTVVRRIVDGGCFGLAWCRSAACEEALGEGTGASIRAIVGEESPAFGCLTKALRAYSKLAWLDRTDFGVVSSSCVRWLRLRHLLYGLPHHPTSRRHGTCMLSGTRVPGRIRPKHDHLRGDELARDGLSVRPLVGTAGAGLDTPCALGSEINTGGLHCELASLALAIGDRSTFAFSSSFRRLARS